MNRTEGITNTRSPFRPRLTANSFISRADWIFAFDHNALPSYQEDPPEKIPPENARVNNPTKSPPAATDVDGKRPS